MKPLIPNTASHAELTRATAPVPPSLRLPDGRVLIITGWSFHADSEWPVRVEIRANVAIAETPPILP